MRILTHNAYWFQGAPSRWGEERVAEATDVLAALTDLYAAAKVDVLCLQEVHRGNLVETMAGALGMTAWLHAPGGQRPDYGGAVLARRPAQLRDRTRGAGRPPHERVHLRAELEWDQRQLVIASVHLPSNRFAGSADASNAARLAELRRVLEEPPRPHVVVGDMNCRPDSPPYRLMLEAGYVDAAVVADGVARPGRCVDYVWLDGPYVGLLTEFAVLEAGAFCQTTPDGATWHLSDHPPLLVELRAPRATEAAPQTDERGLGVSRATGPQWAGGNGA